jgi:mxaJ protein
MRDRICASLLAAFAAIGLAVQARASELRICADPNNLPFSNERLEGFENKIAALLARDTKSTIRYTWWAQRRGFFRNTLKAGRCDVVMGVPVGMEMVLATRPYYRSTYVWVSRAGGKPVRSFDDPRLAGLRIGVQIVGNDYANTPPGHALIRRGLIGNVVGYTLYGDYSKPNPPSSIVEAVVHRDVDVAVVWGPLAGYFGRRRTPPLRLDAAVAPPDLPSIPFAYDIAMGVRKGDRDLRSRLDAFLVRRRREIDRILASYGIPRLPANGPIAGAEGGIRAAAAEKPR